MEFSFDVNTLFQDTITKVVAGRCESGGVKHFAEVVNKMGTASAKAQDLRCPITTFQKLQLGGETLYLLKDSMESGKGVVLGIIKVGKKRLFLNDGRGVQHEVEPTCVLDFYVHESRQRSGCGKKLYEAMMEGEGVKPFEVAIDRPSSKFLSFLRKHYNLNTYQRQANHFVVFTEFFGTCRGIQRSSRWPGYNLNSLNSHAKTTTKPLPPSSTPSQPPPITATTSTESSTNQKGHVIPTHQQSSDQLPQTRNNKDLPLALCPNTAKGSHQARSIDPSLGRGDKGVGTDSKDHHGAGSKHPPLGRDADSKDLSLASLRRSIGFKDTPSLGRDADSKDLSLASLRRSADSKDPSLASLRRGADSKDPPLASLGRGEGDANFNWTPGGSWNSVYKSAYRNRNITSGYDILGRQAAAIKAKDEGKDSSRTTGGTETAPFLNIRGGSGTRPSPWRTGGGTYPFIGSSNNHFQGPPAGRGTPGGALGYSRHGKLGVGGQGRNANLFKNNEHHLEEGRGSNCGRYSSNTRDGWKKFIL